MNYLSELSSVGLLSLMALVLGLSFLIGLWLGPGLVAFRWYRKWAGGKWESWNMEPSGHCWFQVSEFTDVRLESAKHLNKQVMALLRAPARPRKGLPKEVLLEDLYMALGAIDYGNRPHGLCRGTAYKEENGVTVPNLNIYPSRPSTELKESLKDLSDKKPLTKVRHLKKRKP